MEEVQGLVRYIYTGQLSAPKVHGSSWERIIGDFKVGAPLENDDDLASIHELTDYGEETTSSNKVTLRINLLLVIFCDDVFFIFFRCYCSSNRSQTEPAINKRRQLITSSRLLEGLVQKLSPSHLLVR